MQIWDQLLLLSNDRITETGFTFLSQTPAKLEKYKIHFQILDKRQYMTTSSERSETKKVKLYGYWLSTWKHFPECSTVKRIPSKA